MATCSGRGAQAPTWPRMSAIRCRAAGGMTAQPTRSPVAAKLFEAASRMMRVRRDLGADLRRRDVPGAAEHQLPVDLVVAEPGGLGAGPLAAAVLLDDRLADRLQHLGIDRRAGRVERRVDEDEPRVRQVRAQLVDGGEEVRLGPDRDLDGAGAAEIGVVVVVPRRHRVDRHVAGVEHRAVRTVEQRARAAGDQHRLDRVREAQPLGVVARHRLAKPEHAVGGRVVGLAGGQRRPHPVQQRSRQPGTAPDRSRRRSGCRCPPPWPSGRGSRRRSARSPTRPRRARDPTTTRRRWLHRRACLRDPCADYRTSTGNPERARRPDRRELAVD